MPIIEYLVLKTEERIERIFMHGEKVPKFLSDANGEVMAIKVPSVPNIKFRGNFGSTPERLKAHDNDLVSQGELNKHARERKKQRETAIDHNRREYIKNPLAGYDL